MVNLKNITQLPVAESVDGLNLVANDNGTAKQIPVSSVGSQTDWNETNESSPAFIKNKPEIGGFDLIIARVGETKTATLVKGSYDAIRNKILSGELPNVRCYAIFDDGVNEPTYDIYNVHKLAFEGSEPNRYLSCFIGDSTSKALELYPDNSVAYWEYED